MGKRKNVIIITDPGIDDAVALGCAFLQKKFNISLIVGASGILGSDITGQNALNLCHYFGKSIPVARGVDVPLGGKVTISAAGVHGNNGLGGVELEKSPHAMLDDLAPEAIYKTLLKNGKKNTEIWLLAPVTNIALTFQKYPDIVEYISRIVLMGASIEGVANSYGIYDEFNILYDPPAMEVLIRSRIPLVFVPMEIGHDCYLNWDEVEKFKNLNKTGAMFAEMFKNYHDGHVKNGAAMHDATTVYYAMYPKRFEKRYVFAHISLKGENVGQVEFSIAPNQTKYVLCFNTDISKFKKWLFKVFKSFKQKI